MLKCVNDVTLRFETVKRFFFRCGGVGVPITKPVFVLNKLYSYAGKKPVKKIELRPSE